MWLENFLQVAVARMSVNAGNTYLHQDRFIVTNSCAPFQYLPEVIYLAVLTSGNNSIHFSIFYIDSYDNMPGFAVAITELETISIGI